MCSAVSVAGEVRPAGCHKAIESRSASHRAAGQRQERTSAARRYRHRPTEHRGATGRLDAQRVTNRASRGDGNTATDVFVQVVAYYGARIGQCIATTLLCYCCNRIANR